MRAEGTGARPANILLVEDNPAHAELVMRGFARLRIPNRIFHVPDGAMALDYLFGRGAHADRSRSPKPHVILLDLRLPRIDGLEVLRQIKSSPELRSIPVVILTTSQSDQDLKRAYDEHTNSYVVKPMDFDGFSKMTDELGSYWLARNLPPPAPQ